MQRARGAAVSRGGHLLASGAEMAGGRFRPERRRRDGFVADDTRRRTRTIRSLSTVTLIKTFSAGFLHRAYGVQSRLQIVDGRLSLRLSAQTRFGLGGGFGRDAAAGAGHRDGVSPASSAGICSSASVSASRSSTPLMSSSASFTSSSMSPLFAISLLISRSVSDVRVSDEPFIADSTSVLFSRCPTLHRRSCSVSIMLTGSSTPCFRAGARPFGRTRRSPAPADACFAGRRLAQSLMDFWTPLSSRWMSVSYKERGDVERGGPSSSGPSVGSLGRRVVFVARERFKCASTARVR